MFSIRFVHRKLAESMGSYTWTCITHMTVTYSFQRKERRGPTSEVNNFIVEASHQQYRAIQYTRRKPLRVFALLCRFCVRRSVRTRAETLSEFINSSTRYFAEWTDFSIHPIRSKKYSIQQVFRKEGLRCP